MRILFYKRNLNWPRATGHDVHAYNMMRALGELGAQVGLVLARPAPPEATAGIDFHLFQCLNIAAEPSPGPVGLSRLEQRFCSYWGVPETQIAQLNDIARAWQPDVLVVVGLEALPLLAGPHSWVRVWYAADEWVWHHLSQVKIFDRTTWGEVPVAFTKGLYERTFSGRVDRAWVVSEPDARAMRWLAGVRVVDVLPNGVDARFYTPSTVAEKPGTVVFWGRLDFGPNIQALEWFCARVWPLVTTARPDARFTVAGFNPTARVQELASRPGVELVRDAADLRPVVADKSVVVLPFVSGGGIKNKLLEAAAMGKAIVSTRRATTGLRGTPALQTADSPMEWRDAILRLWADPRTRLQLGRSARDWVVAAHSWEATAADALACLAEPSK